jgi:uncharacterized protein YfkK (UPF0435 family)
MSADNKEPIDTILSRIEQKIDYVNRVVDRIEASEKKLHELDKAVIKQDTRLDLLEGKVGHLRINGLVIFAVLVILASAAIILK